MSLVNLTELYPSYCDISNTHQHQINQTFIFTFSSVKWANPAFRWIDWLPIINKYVDDSHKSEGLFLENLEDKAFDKHVKASLYIPVYSGRQTRK